MRLITTANVAFGFAACTLLLLACSGAASPSARDGRSEPVLVATTAGTGILTSAPTTGMAGTPGLIGGAGSPTTPISGSSALAGSAALPPANPPVNPPANQGIAGSGVAGTPAVGTPPAAQNPMTPVVMVTPDQKLPPVTNYAAAGPFNPGKEFDKTGPDGNYTIFRPANLNANGFKFIPATWGNGITTTPQYYPWLNTVASHGFVIIAANSSTVTPDDMTKGLDWLIAQNDMPGDFQGKLDVSRAVCLGYSLGGGGAITCGAHPKVIATVAMHPAAGPTSGALHGPLLLFSGTNDTVCVPKTFVQPAFDASPVPTFYALLDGADHIEPVTGGRETAPFIAWLRLWVFGDEGAKAFFYGDNCTLCKAPWIMPQSKKLP